MPCSQSAHRRPGSTRYLARANCPRMQSWQVWDHASLRQAAIPSQLGRPARGCGPSGAKRMTGSVQFSKDHCLMKDMKTGLTDSMIVGYGKYVYIRVILVG